MMAAQSFRIRRGVIEKYMETSSSAAEDICVPFDYQRPMPFSLFGRIISLPTKNSRVGRINWLWGLLDCQGVRARVEAGLGQSP